jgi:hypothetical protein
MSVFSSVLVYREKEGKKVMAETVARYEKYQLPYAFLRATGPITEERARALSKSLRLYDMIVMTGEEELTICLAMAVSMNIPFVLERLSRAHPVFRFEESKPPAKPHG